MGKQTGKMSEDSKEKSTSKYSVALLWKKFEVLAGSTSIEERLELFIIDASSHNEALGGAIISGKKNAFMLSSFSVITILIGDNTDNKCTK